jgi:hypothetical protein
MCFAYPRQFCKKRRLLISQRNGNSEQKSPAPAHWWQTSIQNSKGENKTIFTLNSHGNFFSQRATYEEPREWMPPPPKDGCNIL